MYFRSQLWESWWTGWGLHQCLVPGSMPYLLPESMHVGVLDWHTYAGLISAIWTKITLWEPNSALFQHELCSLMEPSAAVRWRQCSPGCTSVVWPLRHWRRGWKLAAIPSLAAAAMHLAHMQPGQRCELRDAHNEDRVFWKAAYDTPACPSWEERAVTKPSTLASFVFVFVG